jgi:orotidine-5'-phosphate decarboxylase
MFKVGSQLFTAEGPRAVAKLADLGFDVFLDLKFHDIPNTVAHAVAAAARLPRVRLMTLHASGGLAMMRAAREAAGSKKNRPLLLGVTVLTSFEEATLREIGMEGSLGSRVVALARLAKTAGLDGVVCSALEAPAVRQELGPEFKILVPGVRPATAAANDQSRVASPGDAVRAGADFLVVGRPITAAVNPRTAALEIVAGIAHAERRSEVA